MQTSVIALKKSYCIKCINSEQIIFIVYYKYLGGNKIEKIGY